MRKAFTLLEVLLVIALIGAGASYVAPKLFNKDSRSANKSQKATANLIAASDASSASVAASVVVIGEANANAPASKEKEFISKEVPLVLSQLSPPDPKKLLEASERRAAVLEGNLALVNRLYADASKNAAELSKELEKARIDRQQVDLALSEAAAYKLGAERTKLAMGVVIALLVAGIAYVKIYSITPGSLGNIVADIRSGSNPIQAIDTHLGPRLHSKVQRAARLATPST